MIKGREEIVADLSDCLDNVIFIAKGVGDVETKVKKAYQHWRRIT